MIEALPFFFLSTLREYCSVSFLQVYGARKKLRSKKNLQAIFIFFSKRRVTSISLRCRFILVAPTSIIVLPSWNGSILTSIKEIDSFMTTSLVIGLTHEPYGAVVAAMLYNKSVCSPPVTVTGYESSRHMVYTLRSRYKFENWKNGVHCRC